MSDADASMLTDSFPKFATPGGASTVNDTRSSRNFTVHFWGVRGSVPTPGSDTVRYGGNTACVEVNVGGHRIIFDGGTGLRVLKQKSPFKLIFFSPTPIGIVSRVFLSLSRRLSMATTLTSMARWQRMGLRLSSA